MFETLLTVIGRFRREVRIAVLLGVAWYFLAGRNTDLLTDEHVILFGHVDFLIDETLIAAVLALLAVFDIWQSLSLLLLGVRKSGFPAAIECRFTFQPEAVRLGLKRLPTPKGWTSRELNVIDPGSNEIWEAAQDRAMRDFQNKIDPTSNVMTGWRDAVSEMGLRFVVRHSESGRAGFHVSAYGYFKDEIVMSRGGATQLKHLIEARADDHDNCVEFANAFDVIGSMVSGKPVLLKLWQITDARAGFEDSAVPFWLHFRVCPTLSGALKIRSPINLYHEVDDEAGRKSRLLNCVSTVF